MWVVLCALFAAHPVLADEPRGQVLVRGFGAEDGLRNQDVTAIIQDASGSLWIGTDDGMFRYDGERFVHLSLENGLISSRILSLGVAPDGRVCAGSANGLVCWTGTRFAPTDLPEEPVFAMATFGERLWIGTASGLFVRDAHGRVARAPGWPGAGSVETLWSDAAGVLVGDGPDVLSTTGNGRWQELPGVGRDGARIRGVLRDRAGTVWIRTTQSMRRVLAGSPIVEDVTGGLPPRRVTGYAAVGMALDRRGEILVATDTGVANRRRDRWQVIDESAGYHGAPVRTIFVDHEGTIWGAAMGLVQWRGRGIIERHHVSNGLPGEVAWAVKKRDGILYVGTDSCLAHGARPRWECVPGTENHEVRSILPTPDGGLLLGGAPAEILHVDAAGRVTTFGHDVQQPAENAILALAYGPDGDVWAGTKMGLYRLPRGRPGPLVRVSIPGVEPDHRFSSLLVHDGMLWTATVEGVVVLDRGTWHVFDQKAGFRASSMRYLVARQDGRYCVSYNESIGVSCFRYEDGAVSSLTHISDGLTSGMVYSLGEDRWQRLWIGTGNGLDVVTSSGIDHFDRTDGLAGDDSSATAFMEDDDGSLWIGATGGLTHVLAQYYDGPLRPPAVRVVDGKLGEHAIAATGEAFETAHDRNGLQLQLATDSLTDASHHEYQVRLRPSETEWTTTRARHARYPALPPGEYRFEMRARIDAGEWGPISALPFVVRPAWWQSKWFFAIAGVLLMCAIVALFTWRQRTALRLRTRQLDEQSHARLRALIESMPELVGVYVGPRPVYLNAAARRFFAVENLEDLAVGGKMQDRAHPDDRGRFGALVQRAPAVGSGAAPEAMQIRILAADDTWRVLEISGVRVEYDGEPAVITTGRDVTESERLRSKLLVSDRMASLGTLAAGVAHEINNPLAYVIGNLEVIADAFANAGGTWPADAAPTELVDAIADATEGAQRVRDIVKGLRTFSRSEEEKRVPLAVTDVIEAAIRIVANQVRHRAQIVRELGDMPSVIADNGRLTQVFINLLVNAAHAIPDGHSVQNRITVRTRTDERGHAVIEVADTGAGMSREVVVRAFDPFFTTKDVGEGSGLGLSICHGIVTGLGGTISVHSELGQGTTVRVVLPPAPAACKPVAIAAPVAAPEREAPSTRHRVIVVDDDPLVGQMLQRALSRDYDVTVVTCGEAALEQVASGAWFDAIVSDVMMPNMAGLELFDEIGRRAPAQAKRVIFLSGGVFEPQTRQRLDELGTPQLEKPVSANELRSCVARLIDQHSAA